MGNGASNVKVSPPRPETVVCEFCLAVVPRSDLDAHCQKHLRAAPVDSPLEEAIFGLPEISGSSPPKPSVSVTMIPCELCGQNVDFEHYTEHSRLHQHIDHEPPPLVLGMGIPHS